MRAIVVEAPGVVAVRDDLPLPVPNPYQALVRIEACALCNATDRLIVARRFCAHLPLPLVLGHESAGTVVEVGARVRSFRPGQRVLRPGAEFDPQLNITSAWGGLAEYGLVTDLGAWQRDHPGQPPSPMWAKQQIVPREIESVKATALIPLKEALSTLRAGGVGTDTWTAIVGSGPVARALTFWAKRLGAPFVVVFGRDDRWCHDFLSLGANNYLAGGQSCREDAAKVAGLRAFDRVIEAAGTPEALEDALDLVRPGGRVIGFGVTGDAPIESERVRRARQSGLLHTAVVREETVHDEVLALVAEGALDLSGWISHRLPMEQIGEALRLLECKEAVKVALTP